MVNPAMEVDGCMASPAPAAAAAAAGVAVAAAAAIASKEDRLPPLRARGKAVVVPGAAGAVLVLYRLDSVLLVDRLT
jgi:hypothetical protein